jgi:hypothetical protein
LDGKSHEVNVLDALVIEPGAYNLYKLHAMNVSFAKRAKKNASFKRRFSHRVDRSKTNVICDQTGVLAFLF